MMPTRLIWGATSLRASNSLPKKENSKGVNQVMLPPGRAKLATKPLCTGSAIVREDNRDRGS